MQLFKSLMYFYHEVTEKDKTCNYCQKSYSNEYTECPSCNTTGYHYKIGD